MQYFVKIFLFAYGRMKRPSVARYFAANMNVALSVLSIVMAYLLGSIPFAYIIGKLRGLDVRQVGDRNVGTFNVFRHAGLGAGIATLVADVGKGALAIVVAKLLSVPELVMFGAGVAAVIGHNWPVFFAFPGWARSGGGNRRPAGSTSYRDADRRRHRSGCTLCHAKQYLVRGSDVYSPDIALLDFPQACILDNLLRGFALFVRSRPLVDNTSPVT